MDRERATELLQVFEQKLKASYEKMTARLEAKLDTHHERMIAYLGKRESRALEVDSMEI
jgi:hypothetical protein